jgi:hypothetical protein
VADANGRAICTPSILPHIRTAEAVVSVEPPSQAVGPSPATRQLSHVRRFLAMLRWFVHLRCVHVSVLMLAVAPRRKHRQVCRSVKKLCRGKFGTSSSAEAQMCRSRHGANRFQHDDWQQCTDAAY